MKQAEELNQRQQEMFKAIAHLPPSDFAIEALKIKELTRKEWIEAILGTGGESAEEKPNQTGAGTVR